MGANTYWKQREEAQKNIHIKDDAAYSKEMQKIYNSMLNDVQKEIDAFYSKYADDTGISMAAAKKAASKLDMEAYSEKAKKYVANKDLSAQANAEMKLYNMTMKVNRLELLKANIGMHLVDGFSQLEGKGVLQLNERTQAELDRQAGILGKTINNPSKLANSIVNASFHNATFSQRIWAQQGLLKLELDKQLQSGLIAGKHPRVLARTIQDKFGASKYQAERLMRTELARVQIDAQMKSFERNGYEEYEFLALGSSACDICRALDGKHFKVKDMLSGENAPPMHPNCRCSTAAYIDDKTYEDWLNAKSDGIFDGSLEEWSALANNSVHCYGDYLRTKIGSAKENNFEELESIKREVQPQKNKQVSEATQNLIRELEANKVDFKKVDPLNQKLSEAQIVKKISGGDLTKGSCASAALAYVANKAGLDVLDFRGGKSRETFARNARKALKDMPGVKSIVKSNKNDYKAVEAIIEELQEDKEYALLAGKHCAIIKKNASGLQYLELQARKEEANGWNKASFFEMANRFRFIKKHAVFGETYEVDSVAIEVDSLYNELNKDEFETLLGYINTEAAKQQKGGGGNAK